MDIVDTAAVFFLVVCGDPRHQAQAGSGAGLLADLLPVTIPERVKDALLMAFAGDAAGLP